MKYKLDLSEKFDVSSTPASGYGGPLPTPFYAWQPNTWPPAPTAVDENFVDTLKRIFEDSMLREINNVIQDATKRTGSVEHRGHVIAIALMCALDAISSYGCEAKSGRQIPDFVRGHFPTEYLPHADDLRELYRNEMIHSWNLFDVSISPGNERIPKTGGTISFGLLNFFAALTQATEDFLGELINDSTLQRKTLARHTELKNLAEP